MRKLFLFISFVALTISFTSCLNVPEPQYSPEIGCTYFYINPVFSGDTLVSAQDSLTTFVYDGDDKSWKLDTIHVGDTVMFGATFVSFANDLVSVQIDWEKEHVDLWCDLSDSIKTILTAQTDTTVGHLFFDYGYNSVAFPIFFTPLVKGGTNIKLTVTSTSEFSPNYRKFYIPVQ